jgi:hypothetical protein
MSYLLRDLRVHGATFTGPSIARNGTCSFKMQVENLNSAFNVPDKHKPGPQNARQVPASAVCEGSWECTASRSAAGSVAPGISCSSGWSASVRYWQGDSGLDRFSADVGADLHIGVGTMRLNWIVDGNTKDASERKHRTCRDGVCSWGDFGEVVHDIRYSI